MTAQALADRCAALGYPLDRTVIAKLEKGLRQTVTVADLLVLAKALEVPPLALVFPVGYEGEVEVLPGRMEHPITALRWASGEGFLPEEGAEDRRAELTWLKTAIARVRQFLRNDAVLRRTKALALDQWLRARESTSDEARQAYEHTARATDRQVAQQEELIARWRQEAEAAGLLVDLPPLHGEVTNFLLDPQFPAPGSFD